MFPSKLPDSHTGESAIQRRPSSSNASLAMDSQITNEEHVHCRPWDPLRTDLRRECIIRHVRSAFVCPDSCHPLLSLGHVAEGL